MPFEGRPPGARGSKVRRRWEREQALLAERIRIEELDSDDSDGIDIEYEKRRFASDSLHFTGIDLADREGPRKGYAYHEEDLEDDSDSRDDDEDESAAQLALRDKEEALVQSALARIRRAQEKGKKEVKLREDEVKALERRRKRIQSAATASRSRKGSGSDRERRRKSDKAMITIPIAEAALPLESRRRSGKTRNSSPSLPLGRPALPAIEGPEGNSPYAPTGYYPPSASSRNSPTRPRSSSSLRKSKSVAPPAFQGYISSSRHVSDPYVTGRRALPDEEDWRPSSRRSSTSSHAFDSSIDPFEYQTSSEIPPSIPAKYAARGSGRRNVSGPAEIAYSSVRRSPPLTSAYPTAARSNYVSPYSAIPPSSSDSQLSRRRGEVQVEVEVPDSDDSRSTSVSDEDTSDGLGHGVLVEATERPAVTVPSRKPVAVSGTGKKKSKR